MKYRNNIQRKSSVKIIVACSMLVWAASCDSFLDVDISETSTVTKETVFSDDITATSAVTGIYHDMINEGSFASGAALSVVGVTGLSADELKDFSESPTAKEFELNILTSQNQYISSLWSSMYNTIYQANAVLEGLSASSGVTPDKKKQLKGEVLFVRAFTYFYLVNLFGDVPIVLTTDYQVSSKASRESSIQVYDQIVQDLIEAQDLLVDQYATSERVRPNKATATALLSRVYLYLENWAEAEAQASLIIDNTSQYNLESDLSIVFLKESTETIWQLMSTNPNLNTWEGFYFVIDEYPYYNILSEQVVAAFEVNDNRSTNWVGSFDTGSEIVFFPYKYKANRYDESRPPQVEYSIVFRLAEQYLIRAEARAQQSDISGAIAELDVVRFRAGLPLIQDTDPGISQADLLLAIEHERQVELFTEWGHRWLDLKRTTRADMVLAPIKADWTSNDQLYPLPATEFNRNPNLGSQNPGY